MSSYASANLGSKFLAGACGAESLSVALVGPDRERRIAMLTALAEDGRATVREFETYPSHPDEFRWLLAQLIDAIVIDLDSDPDLALALVERIKNDGLAKVVMVYSKRTDTKLAVRFMRAGAREFLLLPLEPGIVAEALDRAETFIRENAQPSKDTAGNLFVCLCAKGGSGVTTVACNLAVALARNSEQSTLLIDLSLPIGDAALALGVTTSYSTEDAVRNIDRLDACLLKDLLVKHRSGAYVLAAPGHVVGPEGYGEGIDKLIALAQREFDHVVVDLGSRMDLAHTALFKKATTIYLVTLAGVSELRNSNYLISQFFAGGGPRLEVVVNRFETRLLGGVNEEFIQKALGAPVRWKIPDDREAVREKHFGEIGVAETRVAQLTMEMASSITGRPAPQEKKRTSNRKSLGKSIAEEVSGSEDPVSIRIVPPAAARTAPAITWATPEPIQFGDALCAAQLNASAPVAGNFQYSPGPGSVLPAGRHTLSVTFTPAESGRYNPAQATASLVVAKTTPEIDWPTPEAIVYGTALGDGQLCAMSSAPGTFDYSPAPGALLPAGVHTLHADFTPSDIENCAPAQVSVSLQVNKAMPSFDWPAPKRIRFGTPLSAKQLCATASAPGRFDYSPASGALLPVGKHVLSATFSPADSANYAAAQATLPLQVDKATPIVEWPIPDPIVFGVALSPAQLRATAAVSGTFEYTPAAGTVLTPGAHELAATFTPTDSVNYATVRATAPLEVGKVKPEIHWPVPAPMKSGARLSKRQLCATSPIAGTFEYSPAPGEALTAGTYRLSVVFTPADGASYASAEASVPLTVEAKAIPAVAWPTPGPIAYGTPIGVRQLCATAPVAGIFEYSPKAGDTLTAGKHTLSVTFTPADSETYANAQATVSLEVAKAVPAISWAAPRAMMEGAPLSATQLCATAPVPGSFHYSPAAGAQFSPGRHTLTVTFTPADRANYASVQATVPLTVAAKKLPALAWPAPEPIPFGTPLSGAQLCATASVPGSLEYTPQAGETLAAGKHTLRVRFTPTDTTNYAAIESTVSLAVDKAPTVIAWSLPKPITYGTRLSAKQLRATASLPGKFDYSPEPGALLPAGTHKLAVTFTPADSENYRAVRSSVPLEVGKATPAVEWPQLEPMLEGTALSAAQLCAKASIPGKLDYSPKLGTVLGLGTHALSVVFTPGDSANYFATQTSVALNVVVKPSPSISWKQPDPISCGTPLTDKQLCATAPVPGKFEYSPEPGKVLGAGTHCLSVRFTPSDQASYAASRATVSLTVEKSAPTIDWPDPRPIKPGTALSEVQLNAMAWIPGMFVYSPAAGEVLPPGTHEISVIFTPADSANYAAVQATANLKVVAQVTPVITWPNPDPMPCRTRLTGKQLCAAASVPGTFDYTPELGEVLPAGTHTLSVYFMPADDEKYCPARATVVLRVDRSPAPDPLPATPAFGERPRPLEKAHDAPQTAEMITTQSQLPEPSNWLYAMPPPVPPPVEPTYAIAVEQEEKKPGRKRLVAVAAGAGSVLLLLILAIPFFNRVSHLVLNSSPSQPAPAATAVPTPPPGPKAAPGKQSAHAGATPETPKPVPVDSDMMNDQLQAPIRIPRQLQRQSPVNPAPPGSIATAGLGGPGMTEPMFRGQAPRIVEAATETNVAIPASVAMGLLIHKTLPEYPAIAKAARVSGTVTVEVVISKGGTIENMHVMSGPAMLRQAALNAVRTWKFRPYLLNNQPVETRTTIDISFDLVD